MRREEGRKERRKSRRSKYKINDKKEASVGISA